MSDVEYVEKARQRYVVKTAQEVGMRFASHPYYIVDTTGQSAPFGQAYRVDAQERADRWNRNASKEGAR